VSSSEERQKRAWDDLYSRDNPAWRGLPEVQPPFHLGSKVLELGCGNGKTLQALLSASTIIALDFSSGAIASCSRHSKFDNVGFVVGDARELPFISEAFDSVFCVHVLEHLSAEDRLLIVDEVNRVLKTGGNFLLRVFSSSDMRASKGEISEKGTRMRGNGIPYHYFDEAELVSLFKGFDIASMKRIVTKKRYAGKDLRREVFEVHASKVP
jgi:SAM-dependent methyltransferase